MGWTACAKRPGDWREQRNEWNVLSHCGQLVGLWSAEKDSVTYDAENDRWSKLATPFEHPRSGSLVVSAGDELIVWSGAPQPYTFSRNTKRVPDGQRLLGDGTWRAMSEVKVPSARSNPSYAWTGDKLAVWGGGKKSGGIYDPATDTWTKISNKNAAGDQNEFMWSGLELWLWDHPRRTGFAYDPKANTWRSLAKLACTEDQMWSSRDLIRLGDGAMFVCRDDSGSDIESCSVWRYEPRADLWEPCAPPPEAPGGPTLIDCDGRIVCVIGSQPFEYLVMQDAWAKLPRIPGKGDVQGRKLVFHAGALYSIERDAMHRLVLPEAKKSKPIAVAPATRVTHAVPRPAITTRSAVTAIAVADRQMLVGFLDGAVRRNETELRKADGKRVLGVAIHDGACTCLVDDTLEIRAAAKTPTTVKVPFAATMLSHHNTRLVVAGNGALAMFAWKKRRWELVNQVKTTGTTTHVAVHGDHVTRVELAPPRMKHRRHGTRDTIELRDADLKLLDRFSPNSERGGSAAVPLGGEALIVGAGTHHLERYTAGKTKPTAKIRMDTAWSSPIVASGDGRTILVRSAGSGIELYDLDAEPHCELIVELDLGATEPVYPPVPYLAEVDSAKLVETARIRGSVSAMALDPNGAAIAIGTPFGAALLLDRVSLAITMFDAKGAAPWQPGLVERVEWWGDIHRAVADVAMATVVVERSDDQIGTLDVDTGTWTWGAKRTLPANDPTSLDGVHTAKPLGRGRASRRWTIADRKLEFEIQFEQLHVIPGGTIVGWTHDTLALLDGERLVTIAGAGSMIQGACASHDGSHLVTWDQRGTFRRWDLRRARV